MTQIIITEIIIIVQIDVCNSGLLRDQAGLALT